jgi:hypothetical protein
LVGLGWQTGQPNKTGRSRPGQSLWDFGGGRLSHDSPVPQVEREEAETRATKRENSITLAAPAGDEADSPDQVLASTILGAKEGQSPSAAKAARRHEAPNEPRPTASRCRPRPPAQVQRRGGSHSADRHGRQ